MEVTKENEKIIRERLYGSLRNRKPTKFKFKVGDQVRISKEKGKFEKGYLPNFTQEIFKINECIPRDPPVYRIIDQNGEEIEGIFYTQELVKAEEDAPRPKRYR